MYSNFHYIFSCFYLERIPYLWSCKSHDFMFQYTVSEYKYIVFVPFLTIIYTIAIYIYIFSYIISVLYNADFIYTMLYVHKHTIFIQHLSLLIQKEFLEMFIYFNILFTLTKYIHSTDPISE